VSFGELTPVQLQAMLANGDSSPLLLDVRETDEYEYCHIEGSRHLPMYEITQRLGEIDRDEELVVICHMGMRSRQVAALLVENGFKRVYNLRGGIHAWALEIDPALPRY